MPTLRRKRTDPTKGAASYYCKYCKKRHYLTSKIGTYHNWNVDFARKHPNNCIRFDYGGK